MTVSLAKLRLARRLTQQAVADALGCPAMVVSRYERGASGISLERARALADLYRVGLETVLEAVRHARYQRAVQLMRQNQ